MLLYEIYNPIPYFFTSTYVLWIHKLIFGLHNVNMMYLQRYVFLVISYKTIIYFFYFCSNYKL